MKFVRFYNLRSEIVLGSLSENLILLFVLLRDLKQPLPIKKNRGRIFFLHSCQISSKSAIPSSIVIPFNFDFEVIRLQ